MPPPQVLPPFYWLVFGVYEPVLTTMSSIAAFMNPKGVHDQQAPWPTSSPPETALPPATYVSILQLAHVVGLCGAINFFVFSTARKYLNAYPSLQEKMVGALLTPLLFADFIHMGITFWAIGDLRWDIGKWSTILWITFVSGLSLMIPRLMWHMGVGRYVDSRDGQARRQ